MTPGHLARLLLPAPVQAWVRNHRSKMVLRGHEDTQVLVDPRITFSSETNQSHIQRVLDWLALAQDANGDGGIPATIDLRLYARTGRVDVPLSFPETTGYLLATLVLGLRFGQPTLSRERLDRMASYLCRLQLPSGGYAAVGDGNRRPLAFDTGQALMGLVSYYRHVARDDPVRESISRAAEWMSSQIGDDGAYSLASSHNGRRAYYIRATIGLAAAAQAFDREDWLAKAKNSLDWTMRRRCSATWLDTFSFEDSRWQNLHGIAYTIQGLIDVGTMVSHQDAIDLGRTLLDRIRNQDFKLYYADCIPGYFAPDFTAYLDQLNPTGMCQTAVCSFKLGALFDERAYHDFGRRLIEAVKRFQVGGRREPLLNGLLPGSWPVYGDYEHCTLPNWPIKFFLDGLYILEGASPLAIEG